MSVNSFSYEAINGSRQYTLTPSLCQCSILGNLKIELQRSEEVETDVEVTKDQTGDL